MKLLSEIKVRNNQNKVSIQLLQGDLTAIPPEHAVDILVVSAYPNSYEPYPNTLMAALYNKGIKVGDMAKNKEIDLRPQLGCWLSKSISAEQEQQFNFKKILCFEPGAIIREDKTVVGNIFRCINTFAFEENNNVVAIPLVASGNQRVPLKNMLPAAIEAAIFWLENGLPLRCIKLVLYSDEQTREAVSYFSKILQEYVSKLDQNKEIVKPETLAKKLAGRAGRGLLRILSTGIDKFNLNFISSPIAKIPDQLFPGDADDDHAPPQKPKSPVAAEMKDNYDFFISYAHTHSALINSFVERLKLQNNKLKIFYDKDSIPPGGLWIKQISDTIQQSKKVLVFLSPDYDNSPVCWDEFQCAKLLEYNRKKSVIQTIYLYKYEGEMPLIMGIYSYVDCREGDLEKLVDAIPKLIN